MVLVWRGEGFLYSARDGLLLVVLLGGERLGEGEIDIGLSGELISALRFLCGVCCSIC